MDVVGLRRYRNPCFRPRGFDQSFDLIVRPLAHVDDIGRAWNGVGEHPVAPRGPVADAARDASAPEFERRPRGIGEGDAEVEAFALQAPRDGAGAFPVGEGLDLVNVRMRDPDVLELLVREQRDFRLGIRLAQALDGRSRHDCVAKPVDPADENPFGRGVEGRRFHSDSFGGDAALLILRGFQRLWTQNQLAGSCRMASSNSTLTSRMMASLSRGFPSICVGIGS